MSSARLEKQVEKLEAELKEKKAQISREKRKERSGQLVALGNLTEEGRQGWFFRGAPLCIAKAQGKGPADKQQQG